MSDYETRAANYLSQIGVTFKAAFSHRAHFEGVDERTRKGPRNDWYTVTFSRFGRNGQQEFFVTPFGQSLVNSEEYVKRQREREGKLNTRKGVKAPTAYSVLACLTWYDPETFEDFCGNYGYDTDSRKALELYLKVQEEYRNVRRFFSADEIEYMLENEINQ